MNGRLHLALVPIGFMVGGLGTWFLVQQRPLTKPMPVDASGMVPTYPPWVDSLPVQPDAWKTAGDVSRGEVLVYESRANDRFCLARVIGISGDAISVEGTRLTIQSTSLSHTPLGTEDNVMMFQEQHEGRSYTVRYSGNGLPTSQLTVAPNALYVLGDDRTDRRESCFGGRLKFSRVVGRVP